MSTEKNTKTVIDTVELKTAKQRGVVKALLKAFPKGIVSRQELMEFVKNTKGTTYGPAYITKNKAVKTKKRGVYNIRRFVDADPTLLTEGPAEAETDGTAETGNTETATAAAE